jgi:hypothetical protein
MDVELFLDEYYAIDLLKSKEYETRADDIKKDYEKYCEEKDISDWKLTSTLTIKGRVHKQLMRNKKRDYYYVGIIQKDRLKQDQNTLI